MKHLLGAAFLIAVVILIIIGLTTSEQSMDIHMDQEISQESLHNPQH